MSNRNLTKRESDIMSLLTKGLTAKEIAAELYISVNTVNTHLQSIYSKLDVSNATKAIMVYQDHFNDALDNLIDSFLKAR